MSMEYKGYGGNKVIIDGSNIFIKQLLLKENCTPSDIVGVDFVEPSFLKNGILKIQTQRSLSRKLPYDVTFLKKDREKFFELYNLLKDIVDINSAEMQISKTFSIDYGNEADLPPTERQINYARDLGVEITSDLTRQKLSDLITEKTKTVRTISSSKDN